MDGSALPMESSFAKATGAGAGDAATTLTHRIDRCRPEFPQPLAAGRYRPAARRRARKTVAGRQDLPLSCHGLPV